jgi:hypothetical protein
METLQRTANRGSISTGGYEIDNSLKIEADNAETMQRTSSAIGTPTSTQKATISAWVKRTELQSSGNGIVWIGNAGAVSTILGFNNDRLNANTSISGGFNLKSTPVFRDTSAWYHIVWAFDTTQATAANRVKLYVNGVQIEDFDTETYPNQNNAIGLYETNMSHYIGWLDAQSQSGYYAEIYLIDGQQLAPTDFGEFDDDSGIWKPKAYDGTFGAQGYHLDFEDSSALGADVSGNGNNFTALYNITSIDQATDTPTNNFCTINPLSYNVPYIATQGNTKWSKNDTTYGMASGTHYVGAGKWYWEIKATDFGTYSSCSFGIIDAAKPTVGANERGYEDPSLSANDPEILAMSGSPNNWFMNSNSTISNNGSTNTVDYTFNEGDILAFALDMDNGGYWMGNSRYQGVANGSFWIAPKGTSGSVAITDPTNGNYAIVGDGGGTNLGTPNFNGGTINGGSLLTAGFTLVTPLLGAYHANTTVTLEVNFGGFTSYGETGGYSDENGYGNFAYPVPSGFYCLCSKNIAEFGGTA